MTLENHADEFDKFERWLISCPQDVVPTGLVDRCLATIPSDVESSHLSHVNRTPVRPLRLVLSVATAIAATILIAVTIGRPERSVFAQVIEATKKVGAIHIRETFIDPEQLPGALRTSEWWVRPGVGLRRVSVNNDEVQFTVVMRDGKSTTYFPSTNTVEIKEDGTAINDLPYFTNAALRLPEWEKMAKNQGIPIIEEYLVRDGRRIRQVQIKALQLGKLADASSWMTVVVDIDPVTNLILRNWSHTWAEGKNRTNYASLDATLVMDLDYPAPESLQESLFTLDYPADAKVMREQVEKEQP